MDVLKSLEQQVRAAGEQLEGLRKQNRQLTTKVKKLEAVAADSAEGAAWREERSEIRERVTKLTSTLESLL